MNLKTQKRVEENGASEIDDFQSYNILMRKIYIVVLRRNAATYGINIVQNIYERDF